MGLKIRAGLAAVALGGTAMLGTALSAAPASAATAGGGVDLTTACRAQYPNAIGLEWEIQAVTHNPSSPYSWQCVEGSYYDLGGVSVWSACKAKYGRWSVNYLVPPYNAYSWRCT